jgi:hypothetical protein
MAAKRQLRRTMRGGNFQKIRMSEGEDLRVERIAHQVQPRAADLGVVPELLHAAAIGDYGIQRFGIP